MKVLTVVGARPQFIKAAAVSRSLRPAHTEVFVHTGQHYNDNMSAVFFDELEIPQPNYNLEVGSGPHGLQTGEMLARLEPIMMSEHPDCVVVFGDTNSTLAGALAAVKLHIPVAHVEAGLRSFNRAMPEEINRILTDHISAILFCPSKTAVDHLMKEGISEGVHEVGDVMADVLSYAAQKSDDASAILERLSLRKQQFLLATVHRAENTDNPNRLRSILNAFGSSNETIVFPVHPRTRKAIHSLGYVLPRNIIAIEPVGYLDMIQLQKSARMILTDSGGIQKEAYWLGVPCVTLRDETEWVETVHTGWNILSGASEGIISQAARAFIPPQEHPMLYGDGRTAERIVSIMDRVIQEKRH